MGSQKFNDPVWTIILMCWSSDRSLHVWGSEGPGCLESHCPPAGGSWILDAATLPISSDLSRTAPPRPAHSQGRPQTAPISLHCRIHQREWTAHDRQVSSFYFSFYSLYNNYTFLNLLLLETISSVKHSPTWQHLQRISLLVTSSNKEKTATTTDCLKFKKGVAKGLCDGIGPSPNNLSLSVLEINLVAADPDKDWYFFYTFLLWIIQKSFVQRHPTT